MTKIHDAATLKLEFEHRVTQLLMTNAALVLDDTDENARLHHQEWERLNLWFNELLQRVAISE